MTTATETETTYTPRQLLTALQALTGDPWEFHKEKNSAVNLKGGGIPIWYHASSHWGRDGYDPDEPVSKDSVEFRVNWPKRPDSACCYLPEDIYGDDKPGHVMGINVASNRGAVVTAREIVRRLVTPNLGMYARLLERKQSDEDHQSGKRALVVRLAAALDKPAPSDSTYKPDQVSNWGCNFEATGPDNVRIESYGVTADVALAIIAALKEATPDE